MIKYLILFFVLFTGVLNAQVENTPIKVGRVTVSQTGGGAGYWEVTGTFNDESGFHDGTIAVGDILFFSDAGYGFYLPVAVVVSNTLPSFVVRVNNTGITLIGGVPTTSGSLYTPSANLDLPFFTSGMTNADQQTLLNYLVQKIDLISAGGLPAISDGQTYISNGANNPVGTTLSGDVTVNNAGVTAIANNAITGPELATGSVNSANLLNGSVALVDLNFVPLITVASDATIDGTGTVGDPLILGQNGATTGQVLRWNGTSWVPDDDSTTLYGPYPSQEAAATGGVTTGQLFYVGFGSTTHSKDTILRKN